MRCDEARQYLWREPFQPVRIRLRDGRKFDVRHPGMALAAEAILIIGIPPAQEPESKYSDHSLWVEWAEVDTIEAISQPVEPAA